MLFFSKNVIKYQVLQQLKEGKSMIKVKNQNQMYLFDPWEYLSPKRRQILDKSWAGLFKKEILKSLPIKKIIPYFDRNFGRPTKELHTAIGVLVLQQAFDLTDMETVDQLAFNIQWHYALNITEESDTAKYMCPKTLWNMRNIVTTNKLDNIIFTECTDKLAKVFEVDTSSQRLDSTHIKSNMRRLGRICIFSKTIHKFIINLKKNHKEQFESIEKDIVEKYLSKKACEYFSRVKPSASQKTLKEVSKDLYNLIEQFKNSDEITKMNSYKQMERVLREQCNLTDSKEEPVNIKTPKEIPSDSLQNPSDNKASYSGHKGQGYQAQIMETYSTEEKKLNLITYVEVEPAHKSDANAVVPAIESVKDRNLSPDELLVDSLYGSDENCEMAKEQSVELISPIMGAPKSEGITLSDFEFSQEGQVISCPNGQSPINIKGKEDRITAIFEKASCQNCTNLSQCPIKEGKKFYYLRYTKKDIRVAQRRLYEQTEEFRDRYRWRAGIEATMSEYKKRTGVGRLRVRGLDAVRFCATLKALAVNIFRASRFRIAIEFRNPNDSVTDSVIFRIICFVKERFYFSRWINVDKFELFYKIFKFDLVFGF